jgi:thioredoxin-related protein
MEMIMRLLAIVMLLLFSAATWAAQPGGLGEGMVNPGYEDKPAWFKASFLDIGEDVTEAADAGRRVILYFYQDGCPYCTRLLRENFADQQLVDYTREHFDVVAINMWGDREVTDLNGNSQTEKDFAAAVRVQYTPTLIFLNEQGRVALRINGYFPPHKFKTALEYVAGKHESQQNFASYLAEAAPVAAKGKITPVADALPHPLKLAENRQFSYRPLMVLFEQPNCSACDELHDDLFKDRGLASSMTNLDVAQVNISSAEELQTPDGKTLPANQWAKQLGVQFTPSLVFFDQAGKEVFRTEAYLKTFHVHGVMDYVVSGAYRHQPNFQRFLQRRNEELQARGFEVDLME